MWNYLFEPRFTVYFTAPKIPFDNIFENGIERNLIRLIDKTKKTLDIAVFEFDLKNVAEAIIRAHIRGVNIRFVYDNQFASKEIIASLISAGITTVADDRSAFMHNKFFISDSKFLWTGSFNISTNAAYRNDENAILICDSKLAKNYSIEFTEMFNGFFGKTSPYNTEDTISIRGVRVENYFAPEAKVMQRIVDLVGAADKSVHFLAFSFTDESLANILIEIMSLGIDVSGVFEKLNAKHRSSQYSLLRKSGADVVLDGNPRSMHNKIIIIDNKTVIFGSYNFSSNAAQENDENLLIIHDQYLAKKYEKEFQRILAQAKLSKQIRKQSKRGK